MAIPSLRKMDVKTTHPLVSGDEVKIAPVQCVAHVELAAGIWWRSIYTVSRTGLILALEAMNAPIFPNILPVSFIF